MKRFFQMDEWEIRPSVCNSTASQTLVSQFLLYWLSHLLKLELFFSCCFPQTQITFCLFYTNTAALPFLTAGPTRILSLPMPEIIKTVIRRLWCDLISSLYGRSILDMSLLFWQIINKWQTDWKLRWVERLLTNCDTSSWVQERQIRVTWLWW